MSSSLAVEAHGLVKTYSVRGGPGVTALAGLDITVRRGAVFGQQREQGSVGRSTGGFARTVNSPPVPA